MLNDGIKQTKKMFPPGTRIMLDRMGEDIHPVEAGTIGTVRLVDDFGSIHMDFDNGRRLAIIPGEDDFHVVSRAPSKDMER